MTSTRKDSPQTGGRPLKVEVVRYDPVLRRRNRLLAGVAALLALCVSFALGAAVVGHLSGNASVPGVAELEAELRLQTERLAALEQQSANLQAAIEIERQVSSMVRGDLARAQQSEERLTAEVDIYRSLMDSRVTTRGLALHDLRLRPGPDPGNVRYAVTLLQRAQRHADIAGKLMLTVRGVQGEQRRTLSLPEMGASSTSLPLRFRYFQVFEGEIRLPEGFRPEEIRVQVEATGGGRPQRLDTAREWKVEEDRTDVLESSEATSQASPVD